MSRNGFHGTWTVRGEADSWVHAAARKCLLITRKIIIPPPDSRDPPDGPPYFVKKRFPLTAGTYQLHLRTLGSASILRAKKMIRPLTAGTHQLHLCMQGSASGQKTKNKTIRPPDCWDPPATSSQARKCLTVGTHLVQAYVVLSFWSRMCTYILVDVEAHTCRRCRGAHVS